jgi:ATP-dependent helicase/nuclease subunit A
MKDCLTFEQYCAFDCNRNLVVAAGPGAGKTRVLTERYCYIILTGADVGIGDILALTFTEKAAEEMKARIYVNLSGVLHELERKKGPNSNGARRLKKNLDEFSKNRISTIHSFCAHLLREYPVEAKTDPGFVIVQGLTRREMLLKAIKAAISSVNEEDKSDLIRLMRVFGSRAVLLDAVKSTIEHPVNFKRIIATRHHLLGKGSWKDQVFAEYCRYIKDNLLIPYYNGLRDMPDGKGQYNQVLALLGEWYGKRGSSQGDFGVPFLFTQLRELARERPPGSSRVAVKQGTGEISYLDFLEAYYPDLFAISNPDTVFEQELSVFLKLARISLNYYQDEKRRLNALDFADLEARTLEFLTALFFSENRSLIRRIQNRFRYAMIDEFQDTNRNQWEILRLLVSERDRYGNPVLRGDKLFVVGDKRQAIYRFRGADVTVFDRVTEEIRGSNLSNTKPIFWHDKQRLRQMSSIDQSTEKGLFDQAVLCQERSEKEKERMQRGDIHLSGNFRSNEELIRFFNATFCQIFSNRGAGAPAEYESEYMPIEKVRYPESSDERGSVAFYLIADRKDNSSRTKGGSRVEQEASLIADIIARILGRAGEEAPEYLRYRSIGERIKRGEPAIGILFFAYTHIKTFETILREAGIPFIVNKGKGFFRCEEIMEMVQLLAYLADQRERISLLAALRGSLFGLTDPEIFDLFWDQAAPEERLLSAPQDYQRMVGNQILTWRNLVGHVSLPELVRTIIRERGLLAVLSSHPNRAQRVANMEKFIGIARQFETEGNGSLLDFVAYCLRMADEEEDEGEALVEPATGVSIHLMTIHAAKGLEFPMVIIPELDRSLPRGWRPGKPLRLYPAHNSGPNAWNDQEGILPVFDVEFPHTDFRKVASPLSFILKRRDVLEDIAENRRVFYVGCTRAMHHLILTGHLKVATGSDTRAQLSPHDYREGAPILDLLDDIWGLGGRFREDSVGEYPEGDESPLVIWSEPKPREFAGVSSRETDLSSESFGKPDEEIKSVDLTRRLPVPSYHQLSPTSLAVFKRCPLRFYYRYRLNVPEDPFFSVGDDYIENLLADKDEGGTVEGKIIGTVAHAYLEKHVFGSDLDHTLLESVFSGFLGQQKETMLLASPVLKRMKTRVTELLLQAITDRSLLELLEGVRQYSEVPFVLNRKQGYTFRGRIDKLFQVRNTDEWALIDWKTGSIEQRDPIAFAKEHCFDLQLACYRFVVQELEYGRVGNMYVYFVFPGKLIEIDYEGNPGMEIDEIIGFLERYRADEVEIGRSVKQAKRKAGECVQCPYFQMGICS